MITFQNLSYTYPGAPNPALQDVNLQVASGELALVVGPSGSGKSTLLRCTNGLVPHFTGGLLQGSIRVDGLDPVLSTPQVMSHHVGFVFQDPEAQFVVDRVEDEIAFALENAALPVDEMHLRVEAILELLHLKDLQYRRLETLSGGERQRVAIAAALALRPQLLVLDEPTSQLDPLSAQDVLETLVHLNSELGLTVLLAEHRLERVLPFTDRLIALDGTRPGALSGQPRQVLRQIDLDPPLVSLGKALGWEPLPLTITEGLEYAADYHAEPAKPSPPEQNNPINFVTPYLQVVDLEVRYGSHPVLRSVNLQLWPGEILALLGPNGAGKTTLLRAIVGLQRPNGGKVYVAGEATNGKEVADTCRQVGYLPQDPNALLFADCVLDELLITLRNHAIAGDPGWENQERKQLSESEARSKALLEQLGLADQADAYPRDLSVGQRQRVALGAITITHPGALLLDEPTRGLDYAAKRALVRVLKTWRSEGMAILLVTHDVELAALLADRAALLEDGKITISGKPTQVLAASPRFATQVAQIFPNTGWLTPQDVLMRVQNVD